MKDLRSRTSTFLLAACLLSGCNENTIDPVLYGTIEGTVLFESTDTPAPGVDITTVPTTSKVLSDSLGHFILANVPAGTYSVVAQTAGYEKASNSIVVTKKNTTITQLKLVADDSAPNQPAVAFPVNGAENIERTVELKWEVEKKNNDELKYDITLYESNDQTPLVDVTDHADTVLKIENLKFNTTYFWQVDVKNSAGVITHGELWKFKTKSFPDNRFLLTSQRDGNYEIYSTDESGADLVRLTFSDQDQVYPKYSNDRSLIAYTSPVDLEYQIFVMNKDGADPVKVTSLAIAGFHNDGRGFSWSPDNGKFLYSHYDKLYTIDRNGSNLTLIATAPPGRNFRACDWTGVGDRIVAETVGTLPYESEIRLIDLVNATDSVLIADLPGTIQNPSFSIDGNYIIYTKDVSQFESPTGRQLDSHVIRHHITSGVETDLSAGKENGTNDLNPRYSPDGAKIIFENRRNDGSGVSSLYTIDVSIKQRKILLENASMPDWR